MHSAHLGTAAGQCGWPPANTGHASLAPLPLIRSPIHLAGHGLVIKINVEGKGPGWDVCVCGEVGGVSRTAELCKQ